MPRIMDIDFDSSFMILHYSQSNIELHCNVDGLSQMPVYTKQKT